MQNGQDNSLDLKQISAKCLDSKGYLLLAAIMTPKLDEEGRPIIEFEYRRHKFPLEDGKNAIKELKKHINAEYRKIVDEYYAQQNEQDTETFPD